MGIFKDIIVDGIIGGAIDRFERFKEKYPLKRAKLHTAIAVLLLAAAPLTAALMALHGCLLLWDVFEPFSVGVPLYLHLVPFVLYIGAGVFSLFLILQVWDILSLAYQPLDELIERGMEELLKPVRNYLLKLSLVVLGIFVLAFVLITVQGIITGYTVVHFLLQLATILICTILIALTSLVYLAVKGALLIIFKKVLKHMDERYGLSKRLKRYYDPYRGKATQ